MERYRRPDYDEYEGQFAQAWRYRRYRALERTYLRRWVLN